ncbi:hypothetical protein GCM10020000_32820 [Streptomyces olivoverticillatus]
MEAGPKGAAMPSADNSASPTAILLSMTMSQWSFRNVPDACRDFVRSAYASDVTPMTLRPRARAFIAISTGREFRPDSETTISASPGSAGLVSRTAPASPFTRSSALPSVAGMTSRPTTPGTASRLTRASPPAR